MDATVQYMPRARVRPRPACVTADTDTPEQAADTRRCSELLNGAVLGRGLST